MTQRKRCSRYIVGRAEHGYLTYMQTHHSHVENIAQKVNLLLHDFAVFPLFRYKMNESGS